MPKLLIATPAYGEMFYTPYVQTMFRLHRALGPKGWTLRFASIAYADVAESRNFLLTHWYDKTDASHLLFVDADMGFDPQLVLDMLALNKPVTGVIAPRRQIDLKRLAELAAEGEGAERAIARAHSFIVRPLRGGRRKGGFLEVEACGAGILLIQRATVAALLKSAPEIADTRAPKTSPLARGLDRLIRAFDPLTADGSRLSEDFSFCRRVRAAGGEVWACTDKAVTHIGTHRFEARYADTVGPRIVLRPAAKAAATAKVPLRGALAVREGGKPARPGGGGGKNGKGKPAKP